MLAERPLTTRTAIEVCTTIKSIDMDVRAVPGVALRNDATGEIIYTPPAGADQLRDLLSNWGRFIHEAEDATMKARAPQIYSRELVDVIFAQPYCRIADLVEAGIARRQAASTYLRTLRRSAFWRSAKSGATSFSSIRPAPRADVAPP